MSIDSSYLYLPTAALLTKYYHNTQIINGFVSRHHRQRAKQRLQHAGTFYFSQFIEQNFFTLTIKPLVKTTRRSRRAPSGSAVCTRGP